MHSTCWTLGHLVERNITQIILRERERERKNNCTRSVQRYSNDYCYVFLQVYKLSYLTFECPNCPGILATMLIHHEWLFYWISSQPREIFMRLRKDVEKCLQDDDDDGNIIFLSISLLLLLVPSASWSKDENCLWVCLESS